LTVKPFAERKKLKEEIIIKAAAEVCEPSSRRKTPSGVPYSFDYNLPY